MHSAVPCLLWAVLCTIRLGKLVEVWDVHVRQLFVSWSAHGKRECRGDVVSHLDHRAHSPNMAATPSLSHGGAGAPKSVNVCHVISLAMCCDSKASSRMGM